MMRGWLLWGCGYALLLAACFVSMVAWLSIDLERHPIGPNIVSVWRHGERVERHVTSGPTAELASRLGAGDVTVILERIVDGGPVVRVHPRVFALSFVAGRDGMQASYGGKTAYLTPDDLLQRQLYDPGALSSERNLRRSIDVEPALALLARELGCSASELRSRGTFRRFVVKREVLRLPAEERVRPAGAAPNVANLERAAKMAANFLVRNLGKDGLFRYELKATTGELVPGYNWPRHGGATLYLVEAAAYFGDRGMAKAAQRAARRLRDETTLRCGAHACIGEGDEVDVGAAALAALSYAELVHAGIDESFLDPLRELTAFLRSQQRADGEFMHVYDRRGSRAIDRQLPFYTGEAALALARAHRVTKDPADLRAASRALHYLTSERWSFFGSRYYFDAEHWTCQAVEELWERAPDREALAFCLRWTAFHRRSQFGATPIGNYDGGFAQSQFFPPRLTPAGSRTEGAAATLVAATRAASRFPDLTDETELASLEDQVARALGFIMRYQLPKREHLLADPGAVRGGLPGSPVDLSLRIDFQQHSGSAMLRFARFLRQRSATAR